MSFACLASAQFRAVTRRHLHRRSARAAAAGVAAATQIDLTDDAAMSMIEEQMFNAAYAANAATAKVRL